MLENGYKYRKNMHCLDKWMSNREKGKWIADYLKSYQIRRIAVYGYGMLGKHLVRELQAKEFVISWVMDQNAVGDEDCYELVKPDDVSDLDDVDMIIITTLSAAEEVEAFLLDHVTGAIVLIDELIEEMYVWRNQS